MQKTKYGTRITGYKAIEAPSISDLNRQSQDLLIQGYQPLGGITIIKTGETANNYNDSTYYQYMCIQVMVQYEVVTVNEPSGFIGKNVLMDFLDNYGK